MHKCLMCQISSGVVGLATIFLSVIGIFSLDLPKGTIAGAVYVVLILIAFGFLY